MTTILFVHDGQENPRLRQQLLELSGYRVRVLKSGQECLDLVGETRPDLVLLDVLLEGPNGFEVCRALRERYSGALLPIMLCSGIYTARVFQEAATEAGAQAYLLHPYEPSDLVEEVALQLRMAAEARAALPPEQQAFPEEVPDQPSQASVEGPAAAARLRLRPADSLGQGLRLTGESH
jgi:CheY-like chemotaxis protein